MHRGLSDCFAETLYVYSVQLCSINSYICVACHSTILCIYYSSDLRTGSSVPGMLVLGLDGKSSSHTLWLSLLFFGVHFISRKYRTHSENHN